MSNKREREKRREQRLQEESKVDSGDRRTRLLQMGAGAVFLAVVAVVVLIVVNSGSDSGGDASNLKEVSAVEAELDGIPQADMVLGDPKAKVELIEYGDLQCPACKQYAEEILPQVIENKVELGQAKVAFHNFTIIGPESLTAGAAALAAGAQGRGWNFVELFYRNQGKENAGYIDDEFLTAIAEGAGVKDIAKWNKDRKSKKTIEAVEETTSEAQTMGFSGTPSFAVKGPSTNGLELIGGGSADELESAIDAAG